jgi:hypothetical protein
MTTREDREQERQRAIAEHAQISAPAIEDLRRAGFHVRTLDDLRRSRKVYLAAIPILLHWLPRVHSTNEKELLHVKESIVRCLTVPWAKGIAAPQLIDEFFKAPKEAESFRWAVGNALEVIADDSVADQIIEIASDRSNGTARQMFVLALSKLKHPRSISVLMELLNDEQVAGHAVQALGNLKALEAKSAIEKMLKHPKAWVRKSASSALKKIGSARRE